MLPTLTRTGITHPLYSVGHGNRSREAFLNLLQLSQIEHLADIRSYPRSKRNPHFNRENLQQTLEKASVSYRWLPDLGGFRRQGFGNKSPHVALASSGWRNYADHMLSAAFEAAVEQLLLQASNGPSCIMCAETLPFRCHRLLLSDYLCCQGVQVIHLLDEKRREPHMLSPLARVEQGRIIYDGKYQRQSKLESS